jgi:accessory gene regulator B
MINLSEFSQHLSDVITGELDYSEEKKEIVAYGIESVLLTILGFSAILILAFFLNVLVPAAIAAVFGGLLRKVSGGAHMNTPIKCLTFGAISYSILGIIAKQMISYHLYNFYFVLTILFFSLAIVAFYAPVDCKAKPINSLILRKNLKIISIGLVLLAIFTVLFSNNQLLNTSAMLGTGFHSLTLLPVFNKKEKEA